MPRSDRAAMEFVDSSAANERSKSSGADSSAGRNGAASLGWSLYRPAMFACGLRAIFIAAVAVSSGVVPDVPLLRALLNRAAQLLELGELELMHADRMFARV